MKKLWWVILWVVLILAVIGLAFLNPYIAAPLGAGGGFLLLRNQKR